MAKTPRARYYRNRDIRNNKFSENFADAFIRRHSKVAGDIADNYKRRAIDMALVEMYCSGEKYGSSKHKELIERASDSKGAIWI